MKITAKGFRFWLLGRFFILSASLVPCSSPAQGTMDALTIGSGFPVIGYTVQGVGWSFVPTSDLLVTAISSSAPQINFWLGTNQVIATYNYDGPYGGPPTFTPATNSQAVSFLLLSAGQTYFISTQQPDFASPVYLLVYSLIQGGSIYDPGLFSVSPYISQFASYYLSSSGEWSSTSASGYDNSNIVLLGPNFQFQVVPEPAGVRLIILALSVLVLFRSKQE